MKLKFMCKQCKHCKQTVIISSLLIKYRFTFGLQGLHRTNVKKEMMKTIVNLIVNVMKECKQLIGYLSIDCIVVFTGFTRFTGFEDWLCKC